MPEVKRLNGGGVPPLLLAPPACCRNKAARNPSRRDRCDGHPSGGVSNSEGALIGLSDGCSSSFALIGGIHPDFEAPRDIARPEAATHGLAVAIRKHG